MADTHGVDGRLIAPVSLGELERRWASARTVMVRHGLDALVMQNSNDWLGGYVRWFTGAPATNAYPRSVLVFPDTGMTVVEQGPFGGIQAPDGGDPSWRGVNRLLTTPSYVSVGFTAGYDADLVLGELQRRGAGRVGWVAPSSAYFRFGQAVEAGLPDAQFVDVTDEIDALKAIKSPEEQQRIRQTAALQDAVIAAVAAFLRPGVMDFEVAAFAQHRAQQLGAEQGIFLNSSNSAAKAAVFRPRYQQGRTLEAGDVFTLLVETNGPGGYYTEIARPFVLGKAPAALLEGMAFAVEAQQATLAQLRPGVRCADVAVAHDAFMVDRGRPAERRLYAHGQGYDMVERPLIRQDETMTIQPGMSLVVHPGYVNEAVFATICDNYLIGADGPGACLHQTPKRVIEV